MTLNVVVGVKRATSLTVSETAVYLLGLSPHHICLQWRIALNKENTK